MNGNRCKIGMMLLLAAGLLAGCSHVNEPSLVSDQEICVRTNVGKFQKGYRVRSIDDNTALQAQDLRIDAYFHNTETKYLDGAKLVYDVDQWRFDDGAGNEVHYYWPTEGSVYDPSDANITVSSLDFVGYCPFTKPAYIGTPTYNHATGVSFTCNMSSYMTLESQAEMQEYVVAVVDGQTYTTQLANSGVPLSLKHPLAQIKFVINAASGRNVQIDSISIGGLKTIGTCTYDGTDITWGSYSGNTPMEIVQTLKTGGTTETTPFCVIPNDYGTKYLTVKATWEAWSDVTISEYGTYVNFNWEAGHLYTYNLTLDSLGLKVDVERFTEQW